MAYNGSHKLKHQENLNSETKVEIKFPSKLRRVQMMLNDKKATRFVSKVVTKNYNLNYPEFDVVLCILIFVFCVE